MSWKRYPFSARPDLLKAARKAVLMSPILSPFGLRVMTRSPISLYLN
jgi:hypothetical protein